MNQRVEYLIQIFEKIGTPLLLSVLEHADKNDAPDNLQIDAQRIAELLGKTVQTSIELGEMIDISTLGEDSDSMRVALAGVMSPLIAGLYKRGQKTPDDAATKKVTAALESVLSFSENFKPDEGNIKRLKNIAALGQDTDPHQVHVQYIQAFVPVLNAIASFTFGQNEQKLVMEVSSKLSTKASDIRKNIFPNLDAALEKQTDLAILKALAEIYGACHMAETRRVSALSDEQLAAEGAMSLGPVWTLFDTRVSVLETLAQSILPDAGGAGTGTDTKTPIPAAAPAQAPETLVKPSESATPPPQAPAAPATAPEPETPPPAEPAQEPPKAEEPPPPIETPTAPVAETETPAQKPAGANPMSMFAKKPDAGSAPTSPPPEAEEPTPPPVPETPPTAPPPVEPEPAPEEPAAPAEEPPAEENKAPSGNPMGFFRKDAQDDED